jgi:hypothetical protein
MALFTLSISNLAPPLARQDQEVERLHSFLNLAIQDFRGSGGKHQSGNIVVGTVTVGSWTYVPQAAS